MLCATVLSTLAYIIYNITAKEGQQKLLEC